MHEATIAAIFSAAAGLAGGLIAPHLDEITEKAVSLMRQAATSQGSVRYGFGSSSHVRVRPRRPITGNEPSLHLKRCESASSGFQNKLNFSGPSSPLWSNLSRLVWESIGEMVARGTAKVRRIIAYLFSAEQKEQDAWLRDDLRVAANTVMYAHQGDDDPFRLAFVSYFGTHPEKAVPYWQERDRQTQAYLNPKKPAQSVEVEKAREKAAGND